LTASVAGVANQAMFALTNAVAQQMRAATTTLLTSSARSAVIGERVTYTATVRPNEAGTGTPTGNVRFIDNGAHLTCSHGSHALNRAGVATCTITYRASGTHTISATYSGSANLLKSHSHAITEVIRGRRRVTPRSVDPGVPARSVDAGVGPQAMTVRWTRLVPRDAHRPAPIEPDLGRSRGAMFQVRV
jgi:hypothetical protein